MRNRSEDLTQVIEWQDGKVRRLEDSVAGEEPLEIRSDAAPSPSRCARQVTTPS